MSIWTKISEWLDEGIDVVLMYVIDSQGSSPGRQGFKMAVNSDGLLVGSIGGGMMEHKLVELCKNELLKKPFAPFKKQQIHQTNIPKNKSGMICSGEQTIAFYYLDVTSKTVISELVDSSSGVLSLDTEGLRFDIESSTSTKFDLQLSTEDWLLTEDLSQFPTLHIVGAGHVGLALSKLASFTGFRVFIYDTRDDINTLQQNEWAEPVVISGYDQIDDHLPDGPDDYIVVMSFGYQTDKIILEQLVGNTFRYLGMMGSQEKVNKLFEEMEGEGISKHWLDSIHAPIGIPISSKTPEEIAVSILAEVIGVKNSGQ